MSEPTETPPDKGFKGFIKRTWNFVARPSTRFPLGVLVIVGAILGLLSWGSFQSNVACNKHRVVLPVLP